MDGDISSEYLGVNPPTGANARGVRRARLKSQGRLKKAKAPLQNNAEALYKADSAPLDDLREAVTTLDDSERIARRVLGGSHPLTMEIKQNLQNARAALRARETPSSRPDEGCVKRGV